MAAKEQRAFLKSGFAQQGYVCISVSLNVPGYPKSNHIAKEFFDHCLVDLKYHLRSHLIEIVHGKAVEICDAAGDFYLVHCLKNVLSWEEIKQICEAFEEKHPLGRFIDVDLNDESGKTLSSGKAKHCFLCLSKPAIECRRQKAHTAEELRSFLFTKMEEYLKQQRESKIARKLSLFALKALLHEISLTPKPGLVDKFSSGSHSDMHFMTFVDSSAAISGWFEEMAKAGFAFQKEDYKQALPVIRSIGLRMETAMYEATKNINTHKGLIFLMGLSLFACGNLFSNQSHFDPLIFRTTVRNICKDLVSRELADNNAIQMSHGEEIFQKYGFSGARGEAERGFQTVFEFGLPQLLSASEWNEAMMMKSFLAIASHNDDTNILYRRGTQVLSQFQDLCQLTFANFNVENYTSVIEFCRVENISPGGSADLLAVSLFLRSVIHADNLGAFTLYTSDK